MKELSAVLFQAVRLAGTVYVSTEAFLKINHFTGDEILSAFTASVLATIGLMAMVGSGPPLEQDNLRKRIAACVQVLILFGFHAMVALFLSEHVQKELIDISGGYPVTRAQAFAPTLIGVWLIEVFVMTLPRRQDPPEPKAPKRSRPPARLIRQKNRYAK